MQAKLATPQGRATYPQCKWLVEMPIGCINQISGNSQFNLRGLRPVQGEYDLACLALKVKWLHRHLTG